MKLVGKRSKKPPRRELSYVSYFIIGMFSMIFTSLLIGIIEIFSGVLPAWAMLLLYVPLCIVLFLKIQEFMIGLNAQDGKDISPASLFIPK